MADQETINRLDEIHDRLDEIVKKLDEDTVATKSTLEFVTKIQSTLQLDVEIEKVKSAKSHVAIGDRVSGMGPEGPLWGRVRELQLDSGGNVYATVDLDDGSTKIVYTDALSRVVE